MVSKMKYATIIISILFLSGLTLFAGKGDNEFISKQKSFIKEQFVQKKYFDCISETRKLITYDSNPENYNDYIYFIESNYFLGEQYKSVIYYITEKEQKGLYYRETVLLSQAYLKLGLYSKSINTIQVINYQDIDPVYRYNLLLRKVEPFVYTAEYEKAIKEIEKSKKFLSFNRQQKLLYEQVDKFREINFKSAALSITLSTLFPGTGQIYSGRYLDGILSFLGIFAAAAGACLFYDNNKKGLSYTMIFFSAIFYTGNIYGAYNCARTTNMRLHQEFRSVTKRMFIPEYNPINQIDMEKIF